MLLKFLFIILCFKNIASENNECGKVQVGASFSVGSDYAARGQFPWLVPLFYTRNDKYFCGSTIISKNYLLSASHCFQNKGVTTPISSSDIYGLLGKYNLSYTDESDVVKVLFDSINIHHEWNTMETKFEADVALLKLKNKIKFNKYYQPICLPEVDTNVFNVKGTVAGYGLSEESGINAERLPKFIEIKSVTHDVCLFSNEAIVRVSSPRSFCAGEFGKNPCKGDSGSGFYVKIGNSYTIFGIVSSAVTAECHENQFVIFTNVPKFITWIREEVGVNEFSISTAQTYDMEKFIKIGTYRDNRVPYAKNYYIPRKIRAKWTDALNICHTNGYQLATFETLNELIRVQTFLNEFKDYLPDYTHIGAMTSKLGSRDDWHWVSTNEKINFPMTWFPGEPNNWNNEEPYLVLRQPGFTFSDMHNYHEDCSFLCVESI